MIKLMALAATIGLVAITGCDQSSGQSANQVSAEKPPVQRIPEFEDSAFCRKYHCRLDNARYVARVDGRVDRWDYTYRLEGNDLMDVGLSLSPNGERKEPYVVVYWRPLKPVEKESSTAGFTTHTGTNAVPEKEMAPVRDLVNEIAGSAEFDAYAYTKKCLLSFTHGETGVGGALAKRYAFECTYAESNDQRLSEQKMFPQLTLVISKLPIRQKQQ
ncbi:MAG TPA: hypothetical protein VN025_08440 [Candidatus Dormibacteraeota bacterium]|nr:hypothetical protein [Candidatus Dormibacteraeota bacterium]